MQHQEVNTIPNCWSTSMETCWRTKPILFYESKKTEQNAYKVHIIWQQLSFTFSTICQWTNKDMIHVCLHENTFILYSINANHTEIFVPKETVKETYM